MKIPKRPYDALMLIKRQDGETKGVDYEDVEWLLKLGLVKEATANRKMQTIYILSLTPKGEAAIVDIPIS